MAKGKFTIKDVLHLPNSQVTIPRLGFGVYLSSTTKCVNSCLTALKAGYRHIDTAQFYGNEREVGEALTKSGLSRNEVFITTKVMTGLGSVERTYNSLLNSVTSIDSSANGYVDLFLIHTPNGGAAQRKEMWLALEKLYKEGKTRAIGVSNFGIGHIEELKDYAATWPPSANQIELHPWCQQREVVEYCHQHGIVVEAYSPLVRNKKASDPTLNAIAKAHGKSTAQVLIRYCLQKDWVPLPKSDTPSRIEENADVYDFELSAEEMGQLDGLDQGAKGAIVQAVKNTVDGKA